MKAVKWRFFWIISTIIIKSMRGIVWPSSPPPFDQPSLAKQLLHTAHYPPLPPAPQSQLHVQTVNDSFSLGTTHLQSLVGFWPCRSVRLFLKDTVGKKIDKKNVVLAIQDCCGPEYISGGIIFDLVCSLFCCHLNCLKHAVHTVSNPLFACYIHVYLYFFYRFLSK